jgi:hypothetical protein
MYPDAFDLRLLRGRRYGKGGKYNKQKQDATIERDHIWTLPLPPPEQMMS